MVLVILQIIAPVQLDIMVMIVANLIVLEFPHQVHQLVLEKVDVILSIIVLVNLDILEVIVLNSLVVAFLLMLHLFVLDMVNVQTLILVSVIVQLSRVFGLVQFVQYVFLHTLVLCVVVWLNVMPQQLVVEMVIVMILNNVLVLLITRRVSGRVNLVLHVLMEFMVNCVQPRLLDQFFLWMI